MNLTHDDIADLRVECRAARLEALAADTDRADARHGHAAEHDARWAVIRDAAVARVAGVEWSTDDHPIDTIARLLAALAFVDGGDTFVAAAVDGEIEWVRDADELAGLLAGVEHALVRFTVAGEKHNAVWVLEDGAWVGLPM